MKPAQDEDFDALAEKALALGAIGVNLDQEYASLSPVQTMHARGLLVSVWSVDRAKAAVRVLRMGGDNVTTYRPVPLPRVV